MKYLFIITKIAFLLATIEPEEIMGTLAISKMAFTPISVRNSLSLVRIS